MHFAISFAAVHVFIMNESLFSRENTIAQEAALETDANTAPVETSTTQDDAGFLMRTVEHAKRHWRGVMLAVGIGVATLAGAELSDGVDPKEHDITEIGRGFIDFAELTSPLLVTGAAAHVASLATSRDRKTQLNLAWRGLSGSDSMSFKKAVVAGSLLPALGIGALSTALMIEDGIHEGANRNINSINDSVMSNSPQAQVTWFLQSGTHHFMNDSEISQDTFDTIQSEVEDRADGGSVVVAFQRDLVTLPTIYSDNQASMIISVDANGPGIEVLPQVQVESATCDVVNGTCRLDSNEIIVDEGEGFEVGDSIKIRNQDYTVVAHPENKQSLVNRLIAYTGGDASVTSEDYYGFVSVSAAPDSVAGLVEELDRDKSIEALTTDEFLSANEDFWAHNGTPLLILLIGDIAIFGGATFASTKRFEQERNAAVTATLQAIGMTKMQLAEQELARNTITTMKGVIPGAIGALATTKFISSALPGFEGKLTPGMIFGSTGLILAVQGLTTARAIRQTNKRSPVEAMKQK